METKEMTFNGRAVKRVTLGGQLMWQRDNLPDWLRESLLLWYDVEKQGCTNKSLAAVPKLTDFSGNGNDLMLYGFTFDGTNNGMTAVGLRFDGANTYGSVYLPKLEDFTIIAWFMTRADKRYNHVFSKGDAGTPKFTFICAQDSDGDYYWSFGVENKKKRQYTIPLIYTSTEVNGDSIQRGFLKDNITRPLLIGKSGMGQIYNANFVLRYFLLFDRTLTEYEIDYVTNNLISSSL